MRFTQKQADGISAAIWLIGLGVLFATGFWWPGSMFLVGTASIVQGLVAGRGWYSFQGAVWTIGIGIWALFHFQIAVLLVILGVSALIGAFLPPPMLTRKPEVDRTLE